MTYFGFLALFIGPPLIILALLNWLDGRRGRRLPQSLHTWSPAGIIAALIVVAVAYTTPWDNYLVATNVWWYDPALVTGIVIGWVPIEEYTFFVVQTLMTGMWTVWLARRIGNPQQTPNDGSGNRLRLLATAAVGMLWVGSVVLLASGWRPGTYLGLELVWALPPIMLQLGFGADILWRQRRVVFWGIVPTTVYLCLGDAVAIGSGTWTIDPAQSTGILVGNLPLEEIVFFLITNTLVVLGMTLVLARASQTRAPRSVLRAMASVVPARHAVRQPHG